ncbi:MAG: histone deacetylase [Candidatus Hydrothermarchaeales archaeon]
MIVYSEGFLKHDLEGHPENKNRLVKIMEVLGSRGVFETVPLIEPLPANVDDILGVHTKQHIADMQTTSKMGESLFGDTYFTKETYETALLASGGVITCINNEAKRCFALVRPPGHHATQGAAMGFCIFNNVAVGAAYARKKSYERIAILDFDLHHGNGTQQIFFNDDILYVSLHQWPHYPGTGSMEEVGGGKGEGYTVNIPLSAGVSDKSYRLALNEIVFPVLEEFAPDILFISAGYDGHFNDPLGDLRLSSRIYQNIAENVKRTAKKVVFSLEGGYNLNALPHCVYASLQGLFGLKGEAFDAEQKEDKRVSEHVEMELKALRRLISDYWNV